MQRFWAKVAITDGCWSWTGARWKSGYGRIWYEGKLLAAHRVSYFLANGDIPPGMYVLHHCDCPPCVRPDHLFTGSATDNIADMVSKGRNHHDAGERAHHRKLTALQVNNIRSRYATGLVTQASLAHEYGTTQANVSRIVLGRSWTR